MHTTIANGIEIETDKSIEVVEINAQPFIFVFLLIMISVGVVFGIVGARNRRLAEEIRTDIALTTAIERVYAEAQIDALEGRARVTQNEAGEYVWISSPWDDGRDPRFDKVDEYLTWTVGE